MRMFMRIAVCWAPRDSAQSKPVKFELLQEELEQAKAGTLVNDGTEDVDMDAAGDSELDSGLESDSESGLDADGLPKSLKMEEYDKDRVINQSGGIQVTPDGDIMNEMDLNIGTDADMKAIEEAEDDVEDQEDFNLKPNDRIVIVAHTDEDYSCLEVQVYDDDSGSLYVHHDISLPAFPLCVTWLGCEAIPTSTNSKNFVAVGTFHPGIEIWNLDVLDVIEPNLTLGGSEKSKKQGQGEMGMGMPLGEGNLREGSHKDAVMGLSWNSVHTNLLASGSADKTVKLWDLPTEKCVHTFTHHKDKVQSVRWNGLESNILLSGSFDKTLAVFDARQGASAQIASCAVAADVECALWNPFHGAQFFASSEDGKVYCFDVRALDKGEVFSFQAHDQACSSVSLSSMVKGLMATCSPDKTVKVWDLNSGSGTAAPSLVCQKTMAIGGIYDCSFSCDDPFLLAAGGDKGILGLWDITEEQNVQQAFSNKIAVEKKLFESDGMSKQIETQDSQQQDSTAAPAQKKKKKNKKNN